MKNNIRLVTDEAPSRLLQEHSPARMHLAELINRKLSLESTLRHLAEAAQRLQEAQQAEQQAVAALNALSAAEAAAMAAWSRDGSGAEPQPDVAKRDELQANHRAAVAKAAAARGAQATIAADQQREAVSLRQVEEEIDLAIVPIIIDEVGSKIAVFKVALGELAEKRAEISEASEFINLIAIRLSKLASDRPTPEVGRPAFVALEALNERIRVAFSPPAPDSSNHRAQWSAFAAALKRDPIAELKD